MKYLNNFNNFILNEKIKEKDIVKLLNFPNLRQSDHDSCGVVALQVVLQYYGIDLVESELKTDLKFNKKDGVLPENIIKFCHKMDLKTDDKENMTIDDLKKYINDDIPVIIEIQSWKNYPKPKDIKYENDWEDGHYVVVIGYTDKEIILSDSATINLTYIKYDDLMERWHDIDKGEKHIQYGIAIYGKKPKYDKDKIEKEE